jgi:hemerythrin-like domain-containing protein
MDAIELLVNDHRKLRALLEELSQTSEADARKRNELLARIELELQIHTAIEEQIFYPAFRAAGGAIESRMFYEAIEAHRAVELLVLPDLKNTDAASERFSGRAKVLKSLVEQHAGEEESAMFSSARRILSAEQLADLGARLKRRKEELGL